MKEIKIISNNENSCKYKYFLIELNPKISRLLTKVKLKKIFIYSNLIIIDIILFILYKKLMQKSIEGKYNIHHKHSENFDLIYQKGVNPFDFIINKYKRDSIIWPLPKEIKFMPIMSKNEIIAFSYFMRKENIYFEFGSGGSTNIASYYQLKVYSVESDIKWHEKLKRNGIIANYITINLNTYSFGYPGNNTNINDWKKYIQAYKKEYNADIIFIDGRFRVACALDIFSKIRNDTLVLIHDYEQRKEYHILEKYYIKIKTWDSLSLFLKKSNVFSIQSNIYTIVF